MFSTALALAVWGSASAGRPQTARPSAPARRVDPRPLSGYDWLQFNRDLQSTSSNGLEWRISRDNVASLGRLFRIPILDISDGAPVYLARVPNSGGVRDLIFVATAAGFLEAHDACSGARVWFRPPAPGPGWTTSSPAVDPGREYVYSYQLDGFVHRFRVGDGTEVTGAGWPQLATRKPDVEKGSSDLTIVTARGGRRFLYVTHGGYPGPGPGDQGDYQGHVTAIDLGSGSQSVFNTLCSNYAIHFDDSATVPFDCGHVRAAVWGRPGITYDPVGDRVLLATGNGDFDVDRGGHEWGDSVLALPPDLSAPQGIPADSYTPSEYQELADGDLDLGSSAPVLLPDPVAGGVSRLALQTGKDGKLRLLDVSDLSGQSGPGRVGGEREILPVPQGGGVLTAPAAWVDPSDRGLWVFIANRQGISGVRIAGGAGFGARHTLRPSRPNAVSSMTVGWKQSRGGTSPIVANGVLYYAGNGFIAALDPRTGKELWSDAAVGQVHWQSPILVNGVLYVTDNSPALLAYAPGGVVSARADGPCH